MLFTQHSLRHYIISAALRLLLNDQRLQGNHLQKKGRVVKEDATPIGGWTEDSFVIPCFLKQPAKTGAAPPAASCLHTSLRILAIHKSRAAGEASWLALEIPEKMRCSFAEFALADKRILYQVNSAKS
jgi:hypothetical protein